MAEQMAPYYDNPLGLPIAFGSLDSFWSLLDARAHAFKEGKDLHEFLLLGRYWLDRCGNVALTYFEVNGGQAAPKDVFPNIPDVITGFELDQYMNALSGGPLRYWHEFASVGDIAYQNITCTACGRTWEVADAHDVMSVRDQEMVDLDDYAGSVFAAYVGKLRNTGDAYYVVQPDFALRRQGLDFPRDVAFDMTIEAGDQAFVNRWRLYHRQCHRSQLDAVTEQTYWVLMALAGFEGRVPLVPVKNQYGSGDYRGPWFSYATPLGKIVIGARAHVYFIDWSDTSLDLTAQFEDVQNTKEAHLVHARDYAELLDYLDRVRLCLAAEMASPTRS